MGSKPSTHSQHQNNCQPTTSDEAVTDSEGELSAPLHSSMSGPTSASHADDEVVSEGSLSDILSSDLDDDDDLDYPFENRDSSGREKKKISEWFDIDWGRRVCVYDVRRKHKAVSTTNVKKNAHSSNRRQMFPLMRHPVLKVMNTLRFVCDFDATRKSQRTQRPGTEDRNQEEEEEDIMLPSFSNMPNKPQKRTFTTVVIGDSVCQRAVHIEDFFLSQCEGIETIDFEQMCPNLTRIGSRFANRCLNLTSINLTGKFPSVTEIGDKFLANCSSLTTLEFCGTFPRLEKIGHNFLAHTHIRKLTFLDGSFAAVKEIGGKFLAGCVFLTEVRLHNNFSQVDRIGDQFMYKCCAVATLDDSQSDIFVNASHIGHYFLCDCHSLCDQQFSRGQFSNLVAVGDYFMATTHTSTFTRMDAMGYPTKKTMFGPTSFQRATIIGNHFMEGISNGFVEVPSWNGCRFPQVESIGTNFLANTRPQGLLVFEDEFFPKCRSIGDFFLSRVSAFSIEFSNSFKNVERFGYSPFDRHARLKFQWSFLRAPFDMLWCPTGNILDLSTSFFGRRLLVHRKRSMKLTRNSAALRHLIVCDANKDEFDSSNEGFPAPTKELHVEVCQHQWSWNSHHLAPKYIRIAVCALHGGYLMFGGDGKHKLKMNETDDDNLSGTMMPVPSEVAREICLFIDITWKLAYDEWW